MNCGCKRELGRHHNGMSTITIPVDPELAEKYLAAPKKARDWFEYQTALRLRTMFFGPGPSFEEISNELGRQAAANGLTPEILNEILNEK